MGDTLRAILVIILFVSGVLVSRACFSGWRRFVAAAVVGPFLIGLLTVVGGGQLSGDALAAAVGMSLVVMFFLHLVLDDLWPSMRSTLVPTAWDLADQRAPLSAEAGRDRWSIALSAAAGAAAAGLLSIVLFEEQFWGGLSVPELAVVLLLSLVGAWLSSGFLDPLASLIRRRLHHPAAPDLTAGDQPEGADSHASTYNGVTLGILIFVGGMLVQGVEDLLRKGLEAKEGLGIYTLGLNAVTGGSSRTTGSPPCSSVSQMLPGGPRRRPPSAARC